MVSEYFDGNPMNFVFSGSTGTGKNHLACAMANALMARKQNVLVITVAELMVKIRDKYNKQSNITELQFLKYLAELDFLVLDEVGVQRMNDHEAIMLNTIIDSRYTNEKPTGVLSNLNTNDLTQVLGARVIERLLENGGVGELHMGKLPPPTAQREGGRMTEAPKKYSVIYADPPWAFNSKRTGGNMKSGAAQIYDCMTIEDLKALPVNDLAADDCLLVMWWVGAMPQEAIDLVHAWGFTLRNMNGFVWEKLTKHHNPFFGLGYYTRAGSESAIIATKGKFKPACRSVRAVRRAPVGRHSEKPDEFRQDIVKLAGDVPRLEMFARTATEGWDVFGNEVSDSIELRESA